MYVSRLKPYCLFVCGIGESVLSGSDVLSCGYEMFQGLSLTVCSSVLLENLLYLAQMCWVEIMSVCMFQGLKRIIWQGIPQLDHSISAMSWYCRANGSMPWQGFMTTARSFNFFNVIVVPS